MGGSPTSFTPEGKVALMFLKMKTQMSFPNLMEELNGNIHYQLFCDILIDPTDQKLLWECVEKGYGLMCEASQKLGIHRPRTKYLDVEKANLMYRVLR